MARLSIAAGAAGRLVGRLLGSSAAAAQGALEPSDRPGLSGARCNPGRGGVLAMAVVTVLTVLVAGGWVLAARPHPMLAGSSAVASPPSASGAASPTPLSPGGSLRTPRAGPAGSAASGTAVSGSGLLVVDVVGKVRRPGVYRLPAGARVDDAVRAAGGLLDGVDPVTVNRARKLVDGEQLLVGLAAVAAGGSAAPAGPGGSAASGAPGALVDLNAATLAQLDGLPGVGPALAQHILDWRTEHGRFDSIDQLRGVSGIGDSKYATLQSLVTVG